jgi:hypothetical protein
MGRNAQRLMRMPGQPCTALELRHRQPHAKVYEPPENTRGLSPPPPAGSRRYGGGASPGAGRSGSPAPATEPSGPGAKLDPPDHIQPIPAPLWALDPGRAVANQYRGPSWSL